MAAKKPRAGVAKYTFKLVQETHSISLKTAARLAEGRKIEMVRPKVKAAPAGSSGEHAD